MANTGEGIGNRDLTDKEDETLGIIEVIPSTDANSLGGGPSWVRVPRVGEDTREAFGLPHAIGDPGLWVELQPGEQEPTETLQINVN